MRCFGVVCCVVLSIGSVSAHSVHHGHKKHSLVKKQSAPFWTCFGPKRKGDAQAEFAVAYAYNFKKGCPFNPQQAEYWYDQSFQHGNASAANNLGKIYAFGTGVRRDPVKAYKYLDAAVKMRDWTALQNRAVLKASMTEEEKRKIEEH